MRRVWIGALAGLMLSGLVLSGAAGAHHVTLGLVKERQESMERVQVAAKVLGQMAQEKAAFDADVARLAFAQIAKAGRLVPEQFAVQDLSGPNEALPTIWDTWPDFVAKSEAMVRAAEIAPSGLADLRAGLQAVRTTCAACHEAYRKPQ